MTTLYEDTLREGVGPTTRTAADFPAASLPATGVRGLGRAWLRVRDFVSAAVEHRIALELDAFDRRYGQ